MNTDHSILYSQKVKENKDDFAKGNANHWTVEKMERNRISLTKKGITVNFLGTNSLYITDGRTRFLIDPYFSRHEYSLGDLRDIEEEESGSERYK